HLDEAILDEEGAAAATAGGGIGEVEAELPEAELGDDRGAVGQDAEESVPGGGRGVDHGLIEHLGGGREERTVEGLGGRAGGLREGRIRRRGFGGGGRLDRRGEAGLWVGRRGGTLRA